MQEEYYKRFDPTKNYEKILFRPGKGLQSTELNDLQAQLSHQTRQVSDCILKDGNVVRGGAVAIDIKTGIAKIGETSVYLRGFVRELKAAELTIPTDALLYIGVWLTEKVITELEDPELRDPAKGAHNYQQPGAVRLQVESEWGLKNDQHTGTFYPVFRIDNGVQIIERPPPQLDAITVAIARFDRESNGGNYIVQGMEVIEQGKYEDKQVISITEGKAHIDGFSLQFPTSLRKLYPIDPDLQTIVSEPHLFEPDKNGLMRINLSFSPLHDIRVVDATLMTTKQLNHGSYTGASDPLPDTSILKIVSVEQRGTNYKAGADFRFNGNKIDWSPGGKEPAPGSSYNATYQFRSQLTVEDKDEKGFTVKGVVQGTMILVDYQWRMPRIDLITLDKKGVVRRLKGIANPYQPKAPRTPADQFPLAEIKQTWRDKTAPVVVNKAIRTVSMSDLQMMQDQISDLYDLVAIEQLKNNANAKDPAAKKGVFVDPFFDDDLRDQGMEQTAAIIDGELILPVGVTVFDLQGSDKIQTLEYEVETILNQPMATGSMKVNPYQAFDPIPPKVTLSPQVDRWTETKKSWSSPITRRLTPRRNRPIIREDISRRQEVVGTRTQTAEFLRVRTVGFTIKGFGPEEQLKEIVFDGIKITPQAHTAADGNGNIQSSFQVPKGIPAGSKSVTFVGKIGSRAGATYTGRGNITFQELRMVTSITTLYDPLAQTFTLSETRFLIGLDVWFVKKGKSNVRVQIRETNLGLPTQVIISETIKTKDEINIDGSKTGFKFDPVLAEAGVEYAIVILTDDPDHEVRIAEISKFDKDRGWVTSQPYQVGVLLSSSNAQTWTPHQSMDLTFRLHAAKFVKTERILNLGKVNSENISDLMSLASVLRTSSETDLRFVISDKNNNKQYEIQDNQVINLPDRINGEVEVTARLIGSEKSSPILFPGAQLALGKLINEADYISRAIVGGDDSNLKVCFEGLFEGQAGVDVFLETAEKKWQQMSITTGEPVGENWVERTYSKTKLSQESVRIKLVLKGNVKDRPRIRSLRVITT